MRRSKSKTKRDERKDDECEEKLLDLTSAFTSAMRSRFELKTSLI